jgi:hypothetical protein
LPAIDHGTFIDSESGAKVRLSIDEIRSEYRERMRQFLDTWSARCRAMGADYVRCVTSEPYFQVLERYLVGRVGMRG